VEWHFVFQVNINILYSCVYRLVGGRCIIVFTFKTISKTVSFERETSLIIHFYVNILSRRNRNSIILVILEKSKRTYTSQLNNMMIM